MADSRRKQFSALGFSYTTNISYNVTYSLMKIESFLHEEDEAQEVCYITSVESVAGRLPSRMEKKSRRQRAAGFFIKPVMLTLESFFVRLGLIVRRIFRVSNGDRFYEGCRSPPSGGKRLFVHDATYVLNFSSSQMFSMLFRDSLGTTETERNALVIEDFS
ncbi:LOW QUALITY PROTEIN: hypothetical protein YC2023_116006 [Brassica napus]